jgi:hypothetical protein
VSGTSDDRVTPTWTVTVRIAGPEDVRNEIRHVEAADEENAARIVFDDFCAVLDSGPQQNWNVTVLETIPMFMFHHNEDAENLRAVSASAAEAIAAAVNQFLVSGADPDVERQAQRWAVAEVDRLLTQWFFDELAAELDFRQLHGLDPGSQR